MACTEACWGHLLSETGVIHLGKHRITLGRGDKNDVVVPDYTHVRMVSTQHAVIVHLGNSAVLIDTSLNGTYVNSRRVSRILLKNNDTVRLGRRRVVNGKLNVNTYIYQSKSCNLLPVAGLTPETTNEESLRKSLTCELCKEFLVFPAELSPCSHLFCSECVENLILRSDDGRCPVCRTELSTFKMRTCFNLIVIFQKILRIVLDKSEFDAYIDRLSRRKAELLDRQKALSQLKAKHDSIEYCPRTGDPFLLICQAWSEYERLKFSKGIEKYPIGEAREFYCWMVRLTDHWVRYDASETDISIAVSNLGLFQNRSAPRPIEESRDALLRFIYGKCQVQC